MAARDDLDRYVRDFAAGGYPVAQVVHATCGCGADAGFSVVLDDDEGAAVRRCLSCGDSLAVLDSADHLDGADLGDAACPCGAEAFDVAVGFSLLDDGEVRWVSLGLRCRADGRLGVYADWKIDYTPSQQLLRMV